MICSRDSFIQPDAVLDRDWHPFPTSDRPTTRRIFAIPFHHLLDAFPPDPMIPGEPQLTSAGTLSADSSQTFTFVNPHDFHHAEGQHRKEGSLSSLFI